MHAHLLVLETIWQAPYVLNFLYHPLLDYHFLMKRIRIVWSSSEVSLYRVFIRLYIWYIWPGGEKYYTGFSFVHSNLGYLFRCSLPQWWDVRVKHFCYKIDLIESNSPLPYHNQVLSPKLTLLLQLSPTFYFRWDVHYFGSLISRTPNSVHLVW